MSEEDFNCSEDYFKIVLGSRMWPSDDPDDSPYDDFICKVCGWTFTVRMGGSFSIDYDPMKGAYEKVRYHVYLKHK